MTSGTSNMHSRRVWCALLVSVAALFAAVACGGADDDPASADRDTTVLVFAAASLTDALTDVETAFEASRPDVDVQLNLAGSSTLRQQILEGAPADVFLSADEANMLRLVDAGAVSEDQSVFARNRLQIAVPAGNPGGITGVESLADPELLVGLCAEGVPCGTFAREALAQVGVEPSIDTNEPDVRALLARIQADELDAGIVYATDVVAAGDSVEAVELPDDVTVEATYHIASMTEAANPDDAARFVEFVLADEAQAILARHGFLGR